MNSNSDIIRLLCSRIALPDDVKPYEAKEWSDLAKKLFIAGLKPTDLEFCDDSEIAEKIGFDRAEQERIFKLFGRAAAMSIELQEYENIGIYSMTRADDIYPQKLKSVLQSKCPPLLYYSGDPGLLDSPTIGFVGSRKIDDDDIKFTVDSVKKINDRNFGVVSGGAKGIDTTSFQASIENDSFAVLYLSDSLTKKIRNREYVTAIQDGRLIMLSAVNPNAGFFVGNAMGRNKYIYAQSEATIVVRSDYNKGGTWSGATECLSKKYCPVMCQNRPNEKGNLELISLGASPIDENWDGSIVQQETIADAAPVQLSLFSTD